MSWGAIRALRGEWRRVRERMARGDGPVAIRQREGSVRVFDRMPVLKYAFLAKIPRAGGRPEPSGEVAEALSDAPDSEGERVEGLLEGGLFLEGISDHEGGEIEDLSE